MSSSSWELDSDEWAESNILPFANKAGIEKQSVQSDMLPPKPQNAKEDESTELALSKLLQLDNKRAKETDSWRRKETDIALSKLLQLDNKRVKETDSWIDNAIKRRKEVMTDLIPQESCILFDDFVILINPKITQACTTFDSVYDLGNLISSGAFGNVMKATNKLTGKQVAIKFQTKNANDDMFHTEIVNLKAVLNRCKSFVCIEGWGMRHGRVFIAMEYLKGITLRQFINENPDGVPISEFLDISEQLIEELEYIHNSGLAHTDIKPDNIIIDQDTNEIRIIDFGLGCNSDTTCHFGGTTKYMPMFVESTLKGRMRSDWYSLALTLSVLHKPDLDFVQYKASPAKIFKTFPPAIKEMLQRVKAKSELKINKIKF
jgi:hypothetical protein